MGSQITTPTNSFVVRYPQAVDFATKQLGVFWPPDEIQVDKDTQDILVNLTPAEKHGVITVLKLFSIYEFYIGKEYWNGVVAEWFPRPEIMRMASVFGMFELAIHQPFYSKLNEVIGLATDDFYLSYVDDPVLNERMQFIESLQTKDKATSLAIFSMLEGCVLYSAFSYLKHFQSRGKNKLVNVVRGINFSVRDECLADGTEVLTPNGWVDLKFISANDRVAQFDMNTNQIDFVNPSRVVENYVSEELVHFSGEKMAIEQLVTKNHRMPVRANTSLDYKFKTAESVKYHNANFIPVSGIKQNGKNSLTDLERFFIMCQADGHVSDRYSGSTVGTIPVNFTFSKERKLERFCNLIKSLGFNLNKRGIEAAHGNVKEKYKFSVDIPIDVEIDTKYLKSFEWVNLEDVNGNWCKEFIEELSKWDGHIPSNNENSINPGDYIYYSSIEKSNIDKVQAIASLCGKFATTSVEIDNRSEKFSDIYRIYIHDLSEKRGGAIKKTVEYYEGYVRCLTVPSGAFLIRYNGRVSVTGNCLHSAAGAWLCKQYVLEEGIEMPVAAILEAAEYLRQHEYRITDMIYEKGKIDGITPTQQKHFIDSRLNLCLNELGIPSQYEVKYNPIADWFYDGINNFQFNDFFQGQGREYSRDWDEHSFTWKEE